MISHTFIEFLGVALIVLSAALIVSVAVIVARALRKGRGTAPKV